MDIMHFGDLREMSVKIGKRYVIHMIKFNNFSVPVWLRSGSRKLELCRYFTMFWNFQ